MLSYPAGFQELWQTYVHASHLLPIQDYTTPTGAAARNTITIGNVFVWLPFCCVLGQSSGCDQQDDIRITRTTGNVL